MHRMSPIRDYLGPEYAAYEKDDGLERPLWSFGHKQLAKSGVAPAHSDVLSTSGINRRAMHKPLCCT
jgi:hypothetical protein